MWTNGWNGVWKCKFNRLNVNVLEVSAIELKKEEALALDAGYWLPAAAGCEAFHIVVLSSVRWGFSSLTVPRLFTEWTRVQGRERTSATSWWIPLLTCPLSEPFWKVTSQNLEVLSGALSWLVNLSKWLVKLWNMKIWFPALPDFSFQCKSARVSFSSTAPHAELSWNKVPQVRRGLFFLCDLSNKTRISVKTIRKNIHKYMFTLCTFTEAL